MEFSLLYLKSDEINDIRSNIINVLLRLFERFDNTGEEVNISFERYQLNYIPTRGLSLEGCADRVLIKDNTYSSVLLGDRIKSYGHVPFTWLQSLLDNKGENETWKIE